MAVKSVSKYILHEFHKPFVLGIKEPLRLLIIEASRTKVGRDLILKRILAYCSEYPEPTKHNVILPVSRVLVSLRNKFFREGLDGGDPIWEPLWKLLICEVEHDSFYGQRFEWLVEKLLELDMEGKICKDQMELLRFNYFMLERGKDRIPLLRAAWGLALMFYEEYEWVVKWFIKEIKETRETDRKGIPWPERLPTRPSRDNWREV